MTPELQICIDTFRRWLHLPDPGHVLVTLAGVIANRAEGDPVWPLIIGGPSWGKTEALNALKGQADIYEAATLTEAALLSGTPKRDRGNAKGGLLREIGDFGIIVLKDFGSILSMNHDTRAGMLAALREIYDGSWTRHVGVDGGRTLHWEGKIGLVAGCTPIIDSHYAVLAALGDRFIFYRLPAEESHEQGKRALRHTGQERIMRAELAEASGLVLEAADLAQAEATVRDDEEDRLVDLAELAVLSRSPVERDRHTREIELIPTPEAPGRLVICLLRLLNALAAIGCERELAWWIVGKCALDSMPAIRRRVAKQLLEEGEATAPVLAVQVGYPTSTTRRALEDLAAHGLTERRKEESKVGEADIWSLTGWARERWLRVPAKPPHTGRGEEREGKTEADEGHVYTPPDFAGTRPSPNGRCRCGSTARATNGRCIRGHEWEPAEEGAGT